MAPTKYFSNLNYQNKNKMISFEIENVDVSVVNTLRRLIFTDIPNVGFFFKINDHHVENDITFMENTSPLHNEFLAHRLSLIPLHFSEKEIDEWDMNDYTFKLEKETTDNVHIVDVTTEDFKIFDSQGKEMPESFVRRVFPPNDITKDFILITKLRPENNEKKEIKIEARARKGVVVDCICWSVVSLCTYFNTIDEESAKKALADLVKADPSNKEKITKEFNTLERYRHFKKNKYGEASSFQMSIDSECAMSPDYIFIKAIDVCVEMLRDIIEEIDNSIKIENIGEVPNFYIIKVPNYTHTIGGLLQSMIMNMHVRESGVLDYVGYSVPHPLEKAFIMKMKFKDNMAKESVGEFLSKSVESVIAMMTEVQTEFKKFVKM